LAKIRGVFKKPYSLSVTVLAVVIIADLLLLTQVNIAFEGWLLLVGGVTILAIIFIIYSRLRPRPGIAEFAAYAGMWAVFTTAGCIQTYIASSMSGSFMDSRFIAWDLAIGFDWAAWVGWVRSSALVTAVLRVAYFSLIVQIIGSLAIFAVGRYKDRNEELLVSAAIAAMATSLFSGLLPALGPWVHFGFGVLSASDTAYVAHVAAMHSGGIHSFLISKMEGIVCFPSYHTVLAILFVYAHRGIPWTFPPVLALNAIMLFSLPSEGGHYLADIWGGALVAVFAIVATRFLMRTRTRIATSSIRYAEEVRAVA